MKSLVLPGFSENSLDARVCAHSPFFVWPWLARLSITENSSNSRPFPPNGEEAFTPRNSTTIPRPHGAWEQWFPVLPKVLQQFLSKMHPSKDIISNMLPWARRSHRGRANARWVNNRRTNGGEYNYQKQTMRHHVCARGLFNEEGALMKSVRNTRTMDYGPDFDWHQWSLRYNFPVIH